MWKEGGNAPQGTDIWAVANGYVAVTPMKLGETDPSQMPALKEIFSK
jgi:broad specificity polyphosphatase/5'/3'-nucleotidase SurE